MLAAGSAGVRHSPIHEQVSRSTAPGGFTVDNSADRFAKRTHTLCVVEGLGRAAAQLGSLLCTDPLEEP